ncbi:ubiquinol-cytochrome C chaperone family protein [Sphingosinicella sp. LHD-64]|uniref:ubiquinol-cytochrome C chaperone family protein n=1 Tax=Sphingosinicella sp. LHD-64 TaxID=3072139 RepID=UPI00280F3FF1|nr:ubiquinol-cytochrome C chaperone family protein [Sphingosinicella sp. LHD-64]MDQ8756951.1 ubiquinol-cytochrome C chaperone family protein [Sphingosinicella sp. LHD-64]
MSLLERIFGERKERAALDPLYRAIVAAGRDPFWYVEGQVPDTLDGRFDMVAAITALVLLRLEADGEAGRQPAVLLTEIFVDDMDGTLRQIGIGDYVVSKHVGRMMGALGGRLGAFRDADEGGGGYAEAARRNIFHEAPPSEEAVALVSGRLEGFAGALKAISTEDLVAGRLPAP